MVESRCGLLCNSCDYAKKMNCLGCLNITNPFWGACPIKKCCEDKEHDHCGECTDFPCKLLVSFAYDPKQGDLGERIERCKEWIIN